MSAGGGTGVPPLPRGDAEVLHVCTSGRQYKAQKEHWLVSGLQDLAPPPSLVLTRARFGVRGRRVGTGPVVPRGTCHGTRVADIGQPSPPPPEGGGNSHFMTPPPPAFLQSTRAGMKTARHR